MPSHRRQVVSPGPSWGAPGRALGGRHSVLLVTAVAALFLVTVLAFLGRLAAPDAAASPAAEQVIRVVDDDGSAEARRRASPAFKGR